MTEAERVAWAREMFEADEPIVTSTSLAVPDDPICQGVAALVKRYGEWSDPVLGPETCVELVQIVTEAVLTGLGEPFAAAITALPLGERDVLVLGGSVTDYLSEHVAGELRRLGRENLVLVLSQGMTVDTLDEQQMLEAGWVRA